MSILGMWIKKVTGFPEIPEPTIKEVPTIQPVCGYRYKHNVYETQAEAYEEEVKDKLHKLCYWNNYDEDGFSLSKLIKHRKEVVELLQSLS